MSAGGLAESEGQIASPGRRTAVGGGALMLSETLAPPGLYSQPWTCTQGLAHVQAGECTPGPGQGGILVLFIHSLNTCRGSGALSMSQALL